MPTPEPRTAPLKGEALWQLFERTPRPPGTHLGSPFVAHEEFRRARIQGLADGHAYGREVLAPVFVLHMLPTELQARHLDLASLREELRSARRFLTHGFSDSRYNVDGLAYVAESFVSSGPEPLPLRGAVQWFRSGGLELADAACVTSPGAFGYTRPVLPIDGLVQALTADLPYAIRLLREHCELEGDLVVSAALIGMQGVPFATPMSGAAPHGPGVDRPLVLAPWYRIDPGADGTGVLRQLGEVLWQSAGLARAGLEGAEG